MNQESLIYDWNELPGCFDYSQLTVELCDETLRDGLQNPSVVDPPIQKKIELLHIMTGLGVHAADIGLPGAGPSAVDPHRTRKAGVRAHLSLVCQQP